MHCQGTKLRILSKQDCFEKKNTIDSIGSVLEL